jgi:hypothetical protein
MTRKIRKTERCRYGIGEWYGRFFPVLSVDERRQFGSIGGKKGHGLLCLPRLANDPTTLCSKPGGVCSIGLYTKTPDGTAFDSESLVTLCPYRFWEGNRIFRAVSKLVLKQESPVIVVKEVGFLQGAAPVEEEGAAV